MDERVREQMRRAKKKYLANLSQEKKDASKTKARERYAKRSQEKKLATSAKRHDDWVREVATKTEEQKQRRREITRRAVAKYRANMSAEKKEFFRAKQRERSKTPEAKAYQAQWMRNKYANDEEYRKRLIERGKQQYQDNREHWNELRRKRYTPATGRKWMLRKYGLNHDKFSDLFAEQKGKCGICRTSDVGRKGSSTLHIDHCHTTGKVRGLLCNGCNNGLGRFKDDPILLRRAIAYLKKHR
jgi:hypothetical protein